MAAAGFNPTTLAKIIGVSHTTVNRWLDDGEPKVSDLSKLAAVLNESVQWLATGERTIPPKAEESCVVRDEPRLYSSPSPRPENDPFYANLLASIMPNLAASELMELAETLHRDKPSGWEPLASQAVTLLRQKLPHQNQSQ